MTEWIECKISDIGTVVGGATPSTKKPENYENGTIAWITPKDLSTFTRRYIQRGELAKAEVFIPNESDYSRIGALLQPIYDLIISNRIENKKLALLRNTLLPKLMSGELDVSNIAL